MTNSKVSIIIPCYNQAEFLTDTLNSVLKQSYSNWECLIINDSSPDNTEEIAKKFVENDSRFKYFKQENSGVSVARNYGLKECKGKFIIFLDSDDIFHKNRIEEAVNLLKKQSVDIVVNNFVIFTGNINNQHKNEEKLKSIKINFENFLLKWDSEFNMPPSCILFKSSIVGDITFDKRLIAKQDWFFWLQIFYNNPKTVYLDSVLTYYRKSPKSVTVNHNKMHQYRGVAYEIILDFLKEIKEVNLHKAFTNKIISDTTNLTVQLQSRYAKYKRRNKRLKLILNILSIIVLCLLITLLLLWYYK